MRQNRTTRLTPGGVEIGEPVIVILGTELVRVGQNSVTADYEHPFTRTLVVHPIEHQLRRLFIDTVRLFQRVVDQDLEVYVPRVKHIGVDIGRWQGPFNTSTKNT